MVIAAVILILLGAAYLIGALYFRNHFLPHTVINGVACGGRNESQSVELFEKRAADYVLTLQERDEKSETVAGTDIDLQVHLGDSLGGLLESQNGFTWPAHLFGRAEDTVEAAVEYDQEKLRQAVGKLNCHGQFRDV